MSSSSKANAALMLLDPSCWRVSEGPDPRSAWRLEVSVRVVFVQICKCSALGFSCPGLASSRTWPARGSCTLHPGEAAQARERATVVSPARGPQSLLERGDSPNLSGSTEEEKWSSAAFAGPFLPSQQAAQNPVVGPDPAVEQGGGGGWGSWPGQLSHWDARTPHLGEK